MRKLLPFACAVLLFACNSTMKLLNVSPERGVDFSQYKTFKYDTVTATGVGPVAAIYANIPTMKKCFAAELTKHGITEVNEQPDLLLSVDLALDEKAQTQRSRYTATQAQQVSSSNATIEASDMVLNIYNEGIYQVKLIDAKSKKLVWEGSCSNVIPEKSAKIAEQIDATAIMLFDGFPSKHYSRPVQ